MIGARDIVIKCIAAGHDPDTATTGQSARGSTYQVDVGASIEKMLNVMEEHQARVRPCHRQPIADH